MRHLQFQDATIVTSASGSEFFFVLFKSFLLALVTFGLAAPFVMTMNLTYFLNKISLEGKIDFEAIFQSAQLDKEDLSDDVVSVLEMDSDLDLT